MNKIIVKTFYGLEDLLYDEIRSLGGINLQKLNRAITFEGDEETLYKVNYLCRTALRVLKVIKVFEVKNQQELYDQIQTINWNDYFEVRHTIAVDSVISQNESFDNSMFVSVKAKDAIVDQFRAKSGIRPNVDKDNPDIRINIHIFRNECTVSLDSSGTSLHMRGYRAEVTKAPIKETLAAGLIMLTGWNPKRTLIDPMCGSGTFSIEAAMIGQNIPAGYFRKEFGFEKWPSFQKEIWQKILVEAEENIDEKIQLEIYASDNAKKSIEIAKNNLKEAQLRNVVKLTNRAFELPEFVPNNAVIILNPPYGERMDKELDILKFYKNIGDTLKQKYGGAEAWLITSNLKALKHVGLKPSIKQIVFNGSLECRFCKYELYEGSKKKSTTIDENSHE